LTESGLQETEKPVPITSEALFRRGVVLFPEGTYYKGQIGKGHPGLIRYIYENIDTLFIPRRIEYKKQRYKTDVNITNWQWPARRDFKDLQALFTSIMMLLHTVIRCQ
jgi:predicted ATPase